MNVSDLRAKSEQELVNTLKDLKREQMNLRFQKSSGQLENTSRVRIVRRTIARVQTLLNQRASTAQRKES